MVALLRGRRGGLIGGIGGGSGCGSSGCTCVNRFFLLCWGLGIVGVSECGGRGLQFGMPPLGTRRRFLCKVFWFGGLMSLALKAGC